jgi:DNA modification methylase
VTAEVQNERLIFREEVTDRKRTDYLTHNFFPYPARFIPQIPRYFIREYMHNHHTLLDMFAGCGTSLVEAKVLGYSSYGIELNPLGRLLTEAKTTPLDIGQLDDGKAKLAELLKSGIEPTIPDFPNRDFWFGKGVQEQLGMIRASVDKVRNEKVRKFFQVCFASIVRKCSNADPRISKPVFTKRMHKLADAGRNIDAFKLFNDKLTEYGSRVVTLSNYLEHDETFARLIGDDARRISLPAGSVHLAVTSPPFINAQEYFRTTKFEIWWTGLATVEEVSDMETRMIGLERIKDADPRKLSTLGVKGSDNIDRAIRQVFQKDPVRAYIMYQYFSEMMKVFRETYRVLDDEGRFAITIGDNTIRKIPIKTHELIKDLAESVDFKTEKMAYDMIKVHSLATKRNVTAGLMTKEWALVFRK